MFQVNILGQRPNDLGINLKENKLKKALLIYKIKLILIVDYYDAYFWVEIK